MAELRTHRDLDVWRAAVKLATDVYTVTRCYPKEELFGLSAQLRRCSVSIASNIAEGAARNGVREYLQFLYIALGSVSELDTQLEISRATRMTKEEVLLQLQQDAARVKMMLNGLIRSLKGRS